MNYCRFENTFHDLQDVREHIFDDDLSELEQKYRNLLIAVCKDIAEDVDIDYDFE
jgi:hypothetical protein